MTEIPQRLYYEVPEAAQLLSVTPEYLYLLIRKGARTNPPAGSIPPALVRRHGTKITIHRSYLFPDEPTNVTPLHNGITDAQLDAALDRLIGRLAGRLVPATNERRIA